MLGKEEIEKLDIEIPIPLNTKLLEREYRDLYIRHKILLGEKQKLIEKLEKDIYYANDNIKDIDESNIAQAITKEIKISIRDYAQEILKILKGEKNE